MHLYKRAAGLFVTDSISGQDEKSPVTRYAQYIILEQEAAGRIYLPGSRFFIMGAVASDPG